MMNKAIQDREYLKKLMDDRNKAAPKLLILGKDSKCYRIITEIS